MIKRYDGADGSTWQVYGRRGAKKVYIGSYDSKREALGVDEEHRTTQRKIAAGKLPPEHDTSRTFGTAVDSWLKSLEDAKSRSYDEYSDRVDNHLKPAFADVPIVDVRKIAVIDWRDRTSRKVSASTTNTLMFTLSAAFSYFVDRGWCSGNPCSRIRKLKVTAKVFPWLQSTETITRLLGECTPNIRNLIAVLVGTGMRLDEALHLRWDDIDLEHRLIHVHRGRQGTTKSGKARHVPIFDSVLVVLKTMKLARGTNTMLWPGAKKGCALSQPSVRLPFKRACQHAELAKELRLHDLRHTFASLFLVDGGDIFKLSRILGHSSVAITERTYAHLKPTAYAEDYGRVRFAMPSNDNVIPYRKAT